MSRMLHVKNAGNIVGISGATLFEVVGEADQTEGRGGSRVVGYTGSRHVAVEMSRGQGVMGCDGRVETRDGFILETSDGRNLFVLLRDLHEVKVLHEDPKVVRERALAKLTPEEREALGV